MTHARSRLRALGSALLAVALLTLTACSSSVDKEVGAPTTPATTAPATAAPSPTPSPTPEAAADPFPEGPVNMLLLGTDSRDPQSMTGQADTIMLLHLTEDREDVYLVSFTRDMWVEIPGLGEGKINSAFARGGTETLVATVSQLLGGLEVDYALQSNFAGFIALTRWLDGFEVDNKHYSSVTVESTGRVVTFEEGPVWLENTDGLIYVRERKRLPLGDLDRTERQRAALIGMLERIKERLTENPEDFPELVANLYGNVKVTGFTDELELADAVALAPLLQEIDAEDVTSLMAPITGFGNVNGASVNVVDTAQMAALGEALRSSTLDEYVAEYGTDYAP